MSVKLSYVSTDQQSLLLGSLRMPAQSNSHRTRPYRRSVRRRQRGMAAVEFAVCLPVLVLLVFGAIEASSFIFLKQALTVAAYEGVRETVRIGSNNANGVDRAQAPI